MYTVHNGAHEVMVGPVTLEQAQAWLDVYGLGTDYLINNETGQEVEWL
jgi:hypothetical protein